MVTRQNLDLQLDVQIILGVYTQLSEIIVAGGGVRAQECKLAVAKCIWRDGSIPSHPI